jgi:curved DNA-binding protein
MDPHAVLGVRPGATLDELRAAFRAKARAFHPDARPNDPSAAETFRTIREAYQALRGSARPRATRPVVEPDVPPSKSSRDVFDRTVSQKRNEARYGQTPFHRPRDGSVVGGVVRVPFAAAVRGGDHVLVIDEGPAGTRRRRVTLPAGVENGQLFRIEGRVLRAELEPHPHLTREGQDVILALPLSLGELLLGTTVRVPSVDGLVELVVPPGSRAGQRLRLRGLGVGGEGDQLCALGLVWPDVTQHGVGAALRALAEAEGPARLAWAREPVEPAD